MMSLVLTEHAQVDAEEAWFNGAWPLLLELVGCHHV